MQGRRWRYMLSMELESGWVGIVHEGFAKLRQVGLEFHSACFYVFYVAEPGVCTQE